MPASSTRWTRTKLEAFFNILLVLADEPATTVTLSYRGEAFGRLKPNNRQRLDQAEPRGKVKVVLKSNISMIGKDRVTLDQEGRTFELKNDAVIVCAGGVLPTPFLKQIGVMVETHYGTAIAR